MRAHSPSWSSPPAARSAPQRPDRPLRTCGAVSAQQVAPLAWVTQLETLEDVLHRGLAIADVVVQDEYTHDVVTTAGGVAGELYVVFDST